MAEEHVFCIDDYNETNNSLRGLLYGETNAIANMANAASLLWHSLSDINWVGFYLYDKNNNNLVLGPFQGKPACVRINPDKGVCGACYSTKSIQRIANVHEFPGHIACDSASNSEIVLPIFKDDEVIALLDIDSPKTNRFSKTDENGLTEFISILSQMTDLSSI